jgi:hypothetical protein
MFDKMRKCLNDFEASFNKSELTKEEEADMCLFYLNFAKAMLLECPEVEKVAKNILVEKGLFNDMKIRFCK